MGSVFNPKPEVTLDALRWVVGLVRNVASKLGGVAGSSSTASDPTGCNHLAGLDKIPPLVRGLVIRSGIGSYDCEVDIGGGHIAVCSALTPVVNDIYGVSQSCMPTPGSWVLAYVPAIGLSQARCLRGVILGVLPETLAHGTSSGGSVKKLADTEFPEGGVSQLTESGPATIASDRDYRYRGEFQCGRPHDIVPGEYALTNHNGAGLVIGALSTTVKGSEGASVRCSALDNQVRVISGHFRHIHAAGSDEVFNDGGFISVESSVSMYQAERLGLKKDGPAFTWSPGSLKELQERRSGVEPKKKGQTAKKRLYRYSGYLGDIVNVFVANPDPSVDIETMSAGSADQGLLHYHVDSSGRFTMRSAGGILLERYDRIPIPKRKHYSWDPEGDSAEDSSPDQKTGFSLPEDHPMAGGLVLGDMAAWWNQQAYSRFVQFEKDFTVPDQDKLKCPDDNYDTLGDGHESYSKYDTRHSYVGLTPDGGIVLRDAWGSEIVMADGRITLNAAANIEIRSGSSVVILGGDDVVAKAYNSLDLSTTKKDVRIKAENNLQVVSMKKGVLIQSKAEGDASSWEKPGEDVVSSGVVLKAEKSSVVLRGDKTSVQSKSSVNVAAFDDDGKPSGAIILSGRTLSAVAEENVVLTAEGTSGLMVSGQSALICAPSVLAVGGQSAADIAGNKLMLGLPVDIGNMYSSLISICKSYVQLYLNKSDWLSPYEPKVFSQIDFRFRTSEQYGTDKQDSGLFGGSFSVYMPSWAVLAESQRKAMNGCKTKAWDEGKDDAGEYPWPGKDAMSSGYVTYKEQNIVDENGTEKPNTDAASLDTTSFSEYHIRNRD